MDVRLLGFGSIEVEGRAYEHDIVIDRGAVRKRTKKPSKPYRDKFGHTPLSADEELPWGGRRLIIGTGAYGSLPTHPAGSTDRFGAELADRAVRTLTYVVGDHTKAIASIFALWPRAPIEPRPSD